MIKDGCLVFFYVDDIVIAYPRAKAAFVEKTVASLRIKYNLTGGDDL
jgi:hypothetical protein